MTDRDPGQPAVGEEWSPGPDPAARADVAAPADAGQQPVRGIARAVDQHSEQQGEVLRFRLDCYDTTGERRRAVAVEMNAVSIGGRVGEGHQVEVIGRWDRGGTLLADVVTDLMTGAVVRPLGFQQALTRRYGRRGSRWVLVFFGVLAAFVLAIAVTIVVSVAGHSGGGRSQAMPDVVGESVGNAEFAVAKVNAGVRVRVVGDEFCTVVGQDPPPGTSLSGNSVVTLIARATGGDDPQGCR